MKKKNSRCPKCKNGFLVWCEDGIIRCPQCGFVSPKKTRKFKRTYSFKVAELQIRSNKEKKVLP